MFAVFCGLDWIATVRPTVRMTAEVFGREKASIVFGWIVASHQMGAAYSAGAYAPAFVVAGILGLVAAVAVLPIALRKRVLTTPA